MSSLCGLYNTVKDIQPGNEFNTLVAQIIFKRKIFIVQTKTYIYTLEEIEGEQIIRELEDYCYNLERARWLVNQIPKGASFSASWMRYAGKTTYSCMIDDSAKANRSKDVIYIDIHEDEEAFSISKAVLLWKIRSMINNKENFNIDDYWVERSQNESN